MLGKDAQQDNDMAEFEPLDREMLYEQIHDALKTKMMMGRFAPGQKLPLRSLAKSLGTSLMPVRDALQRLESVGVLTSTRSRTMMVPILSSKEQDDISNIRAILESETAAKAAIHRTDDELAFLDLQCAANRAAVEQGNLESFLETNFRFHMSIAAASRISFIGAILEPLWLINGPVVRTEVPDHKYLVRAVDFHERIYAAIAAHDAEAASQEMRGDILARPSHL
jgi:DNA-binding GntR family transcriptional regulator